MYFIYCHFTDLFFLLMSITVEARLNHVKCWTFICPAFSVKCYVHHFNFGNFIEFVTKFMRYSSNSVKMNVRLHVYLKNHLKSTNFKLKDC